MKLVFKFILSIIIICLLGSCASNTSETTETTDESYQLYDLYQITGETSTFSDIVNSNPIDAEYNKELLTADEKTVMDIEKNYITKWQQEMDDSVKKLLKVLSQEDAQLFEQGQKEWQRAMDADLKLTNDILHSDDYDLALGTSSASLFLSEKREIYRSRTIKIKYMHYLFEREQGNEKAFQW